MLLLLTLRGTPTIYYGDEIGMHDGDISPAQERDPFGKRVPGQGLGRDPERTPMQWDSTPNAGFCPPECVPWLPVADDYQQINVAVEEQQPMSMLALTRQLLALRRATPALYGGSYRPVHDVPANCFAYIREAGSQQFLVALNFSSHEQHLALSDLGMGEMLLSTHAVDRQTVNLSNLSLSTNEGCIVKLTKK
jgi:alpha-glucosidase